MDTRQTHDKEHYHKRARLATLEDGQPTNDSPSTRQFTPGVDDINTHRSQDEMSRTATPYNNQQSAEANGSAVINPLAKALVSRAAARAAAARAAASRPAPVKSSVTHRYDSRGFDELGKLLNLDKPDIFGLLRASLSCFKTLRGQRDYQLERQEYSKQLTRRTIQELRKQADDYRTQCLKLRQANDELRAARGIPPKGDTFDDDDDDDHYHDSDNDQRQQQPIDSSLPDHIKP